MKIPFFPNTGDGTHCFQAALMMALAVVMPKRKFTYAELDKISAKLSGKWTWPTSAMLWMIENGLKIKLIEEFNYYDFIERGGDYLLDRFGEEVGRAQMEMSDVKIEQKIARKFAAIAPLEYRVPVLQDIKKELAKGAVVIVNLNAATLHGLKGYSGHFVVITEIGKKTVRLHDPGLPPYPDFEVPFPVFNAAWGYPSERDKNLLAIKT